jgi:site-specific DNA-methyltransferase (adenine-specific)
LLKRNNVYLGDCLEVMKEIKSGSIDLICTDLPFQMTHNSWDVLIPFEELWEQYKRIIKDNGAILLFSCGKFVYQCINSNPEWYRYEWIWAKNTMANFANAKRMPMRSHENILVFYKKLPGYNPQGLRDASIIRNCSKKNGDSYASPSLKTDYIQTQTGYPHSVLNFKSVPTSKTVHSTQKPIPLLEFLIRSYTKEGELVLDSCAGSGGVGLACQNTNRDFILIEKEKKYFDIINERISVA